MDELKLVPKSNADRLEEAKVLMQRAMNERASLLAQAIDAMIDAKVAIAIEELADRIQDASGVRP